jgi:hypothetical protein
LREVESIIRLYAISPRECDRLTRRLFNARSVMGSRAFMGLGGQPTQATQNSSLPTGYRECETPHLRQHLLPSLEPEKYRNCRGHDWC